MVRRYSAAVGAVLVCAGLASGCGETDADTQAAAHRNYIGGIERGERSPSVAVVVTLAGALGVSLADLFGQAERVAR